MLFYLCPSNLPFDYVSVDACANEECLASEFGPAVDIASAKIVESTDACAYIRPQN